MNNTIGTYIYINHLRHSPLSISKKLKSFRCIFHTFFFIKPHCELWNPKVSQKLLTSSFSNFKHEKTSLNMIPQSLQALKKTETKILFKEKTAYFFKMHMHWDQQLCMCCYLQTGRSGGQSVQWVLHLLWHLSCLPGTSVPHPASPLPFCVLLLKQGRLCSDSSDILAKAHSVCQVTKFYSLNRPLNSLNWNASSALWFFKLLL